MSEAIVTTEVATSTSNSVKILTPAESRLLTKLEEAIGIGLKTFQEVYNALFKIRDQRLYRSSHDTFEEYCRDKWKFTSRQANRLIGAGGVVENLNVQDQLVSPLAIPENEAQARPLVSLPPAKQIEASRIVAEKPGKHTTKDFEEAAEEVAPKVVKTGKTGTSKTGNSGLDKLMELVDQAQTMARKIVNGDDLVKMLGDVAKVITRKLNGGASC